MTHPTTAARDLYAAILREPSCDLVRLAYADELDGAGECERAEWILFQINNPKRPYVEDSGCQCPLGRPPCSWCTDRTEEQYDEHQRQRDELENWLRIYNYDPAFKMDGVKIEVRRGFVDSVAMTMRQFTEGTGCSYHRIYVDGCLGCTPGLASVICEKWPVTEIRLTDREPWYERGYGGEHCWWRESAWSNRGGHSRNEVGNLPDELFDKIAELYPDNRLSWNGPPHNQHIGFPTRESAMLASSHAAVAYARELAGLPALNFPRIGSEGAQRLFRREKAIA